MRTLAGIAFSLNIVVALLWVVYGPAGLSPTRHTTECVQAAQTPSQAQDAGAQKTESQP